MSIDVKQVLKYGTKEHKKILDAYRDRMQMAKKALDKRTEQWAANEDIFMSYIPAKEDDALRKNKRKTGDQNYVTIALPYSYATLLSAHTYYTSVFLARSPVMQVSGRHGESQQSEMAIEALLDYQMVTGQNLVPFFNWLLDPGRYGIGWIGHFWDQETVTVAKYVDVPETKFGFKTGKIRREIVEEEQIGYAGLRYFNVRPQDMWTDPRVPAAQFQSGEFCCRYTELGWNKVKDKEATGQYFNILDAKIRSAQSKATDRDTGSPRVILPNEDDSEHSLLRDDKNPAYLRLHEFHWDIIPRDWGIGTSTKRQKWVFTISNEAVIIGAQPLGFLSGKFPFDILEHEVDAYSMYKRSMLEIMDPLNKTMEWLVNSHFYNVRAALNNQLIVDPSKIVMKDFENPEPGRLLRLKPIAYGTDTRLAVSQLQVQDITRANISDTEIVAQMLQRVSGINDQIMGMMDGGRKTATEIRSSTTFGVNRMKTNCEYFSAMGFAPLTQKAIQATQQMYDMERKYRIVGNLAQWSERYMNISPKEITGFYDYVPVDGTLPVDRFAQANLWKELLTAMPGMPMVGQAYDIPKIFAYVAQLSGLKNIDQFRIQIMGNEQIQQGVQSGNLVPAGAATPNMNEPKQLPGMGATG